MALKVIHKPQLNLWMILIPIVFVYYFYELQRFAKGKKDFVKHFVFTRRLIVDEACSVVETGEEPDFNQMAEHENVPECALDEYKNWSKVLMDHYIKLLGTNGDSFAALVNQRYKKKGTYLLILDQINKAEARFYKALRKELGGNQEGVGDVIETMEKSLDSLRRQEANDIFQ